MKTCTKCKMEKPLDAFYVSVRGSMAQCKTCTSSDRKEYAKANKAKRAASNKKWREENKEHVKAHYLATLPRRLALAKQRLAEKFAADPAAKEKHLQYNRERWARSKEAWKPTRDAYQAANKAKIKMNGAAYYAANKSKILAKVKEYQPKARELARKRYAEHPEKAQARGVKYDRRAQGAKGSCSPAQVKARFELFGNKCAYCGGKAESVDHVIPLARGGSNWPANLRPACSRCNSSKRDKKLSEWRPTHAVAA